MSDQYSAHTVWLISPLAHQPGHFWENTRKLARELLNKGYDVHITCYEVPAQHLRFNDGDFQIVSPGPTARSILRVLIPSERWRNPLMCAVSASFRGAARRGAVTLCADGPVPLFAFLAGLGFFRGVVTVFGMVPKVNRGSVIHWLRTKIIGHAVKRRRLRVVCETETVAEFWRLSGGGNAVSVIPYALESVGSPINRDDARKSLGISPEEPLVLLFGIHREDKDYKTVILAAKSLAASPLLLFAGKSLSAPSPSRLCADAGYSRYLAIDEFIPRDKLPLFFRASDVIVLPYPADFERGSGLVIEACSYGCPIVASSGGYLERFVRSNDIGETYEAGNPLSLCAALTRALDSERQSAIRARMPRIAEDHSMRKLVNSYIVSFSLLNDAGKRITT